MNIADSPFARKIRASRAMVRQRSYPASIAAPIGGWNARDALGDMDPLDAVSMTDFWPTTTYVQQRLGESSYATGLSGQVQSLLSYSGPSTNKLFGASVTSIFDVSSSGAVGAASVTGLTNAQFQHINVSTTGGNYLQCVNGADKLRIFDGTNWHTDGDGAPYDISGVNTNTWINLNLFKFRVWGTQQNTLKWWYLPTGAIGGAAASLDLSGVARRGGSGIAMGTWTIDAGYGVDDHAVFVTSNGEIIVYRGTDPSSSTTWALVGVWQLGSPIGKRCFLKYGGDLLLITYDGILPLAAALQSSRINPKVALSDKIYSAIGNATTLYGSTFGWQMEYFAKANMLLINVPVAVGSQQQYVMNTITKSWANFTGWASNCWALYNDNLYFGGNTVVNKAWDTYADIGQAISSTCQQAFNYFGSPGITKRWTMARPVIATNGMPATYFNVNTDFDNSAITAPLTYSPTQAGKWDISAYDSGIWGTDLQIQKAWQGVNGVGKCAAGTLKVVSAGIQVQWMSTDYAMERGAIL